MALDYQKTVYTNFTHRPETRLTRTSYGNMNRWRQHPELFGHLIRCDLVEEVDERQLRRMLLSQMRGRAAASQGRLDPQVVNQHRSSRQESAYKNVIPYIPSPGLHDDQGVPELPRLGKRSAMAIPHDPDHPVHLGYYKSGGYDDAHKASIKLMQKGVFPVAVNGPRLLRAGRMGASWRHTKEVMQAMGKRHMFVDGIVTQDDMSRLKNVLTANKVPTSLDYGSHLNQTGSPRTNEQPQNFTKMTVYHDPAVQKGTEKNNWFIMR